MTALSKPINFNQIDKMTGDYTPLRFKSNEENWQFEHADCKNNTVRKVDENDQRFKTLKNYQHRKLEIGELIIEIENAENGALFCRSVRHVAFYEELCVITWYEG